MKNIAIKVLRFVLRFVLRRIYWIQADLPGVLRRYLVYPAEKLGHKLSPLEYWLEEKIEQLESEQSNANHH